MRRGGAVTDTAGEEAEASSSLALAPPRHVQKLSVMGSGAQPRGLGRVLCSCGWAPEEPGLTDT